jgi:hypothetical protein
MRHGIHRHAPRRALLAIAGVAALMAAAAPVAAPRAGDGDRAALQKITPTRVGQVRLGMTAEALRERRLVGPLRQGCELAGPGARTARLRAPLRGSVDFTRREPRRARNIAVRGGAAARGVRVGSRRAAIRAAFPRARFDASTEDVFGVTLVRIPKGGGGRMQMTVSVRTGRVTEIGIPYIAFCD